MPIDPEQRYTVYRYAIVGGRAHVRIHSDEEARMIRSDYPDKVTIKFAVWDNQTDKCVNLTWNDREDAQKWCDHRNVPVVRAYKVRTI